MWATTRNICPLSRQLADINMHTVFNPGVINTDMLATAFGKDGAAGYPDAKAWAKNAAPFILGLWAGRPCQ